MSRAPKVVVAGLVGASLLVVPANAHTIKGNLPGGTSIEVSIDSPANGAVLQPGPLTVTGTAAVGQSPPIPATTLVYVMDVSGSTSNPSLTGCGGDPNHNEESNLVLDCEIAAAQALQQKAVDRGTVGKVGGVVFATTARTMDVVDSREGDDEDQDTVDLLTGVRTDADKNGQRDIDDVLTSLFSKFGGDGGLTRFSFKNVGNGTNFVDGILRAADVANAAGNGPVLVAFLSDGLSSEGGTVAEAVRSLPPNASVFSFAVGASSDCATKGTQGSLDEVAVRGKCTKVGTVADLPDVLPTVIDSHLTQLAISVDGSEETTIADVTPALPVTGPASVTYRAPVGTLTSGAHRICVRAIGTDGGGTGSVTDCHSIVVNASPVVSAGGPYTGLQGTDVPITGTVTDPDTPQPTTTWSIEPATGCNFANGAALSTTVNCANRGTYSLTLTASDGVNPPVSASTTLTLTNGVPVVSAGGPYTGQENTGIPITGTVTDPDGPQLTTQWTSEPDCAFANPAALATVVTCPAVGTFTLTLTANDGVNPPVTATATLSTSKAPDPKGPLTLSTEVGPATGFAGGDDVVVTYRAHNGSPSVMPAVVLATTTTLTPKTTRCPCALGDLQPNQTAEVKLVFAAVPTDTTVSGTITTTGPDSDPADNTAVARVLVKQPTVTADQRVAPLGSVVHLRGKDFPAGARVRLAWSAGLSETPGELVVGADGVLDASMLLFHHDMVGPRVVVVTRVDGTRFGDVRSEDVIAVPRMLQPPDFVTRG